MQGAVAPGLISMDEKYLGKLGIPVHAKAPGRTR
jgi:hypothetical protein